jgi:hypothetical protein
VVSLLAASEAPRAEAVRRLARRGGGGGYLSRPLAFPGDGYYAAEMGAPLTRRLLAFREPVGLDELVRVKLACRALEADLAIQGRRLVNLDPGLLTGDSLILATTKYNGHRLPLDPGNGLWQELTLWYRQGRYQALPWTYPDYAGQDLGQIMSGLRRRHLWRLRQAAAQGG